MKNNYLIFRTDRIGDFLVTAILIKCIKQNDPSSSIILISSKKNYFYAKDFPYIDNIILLKNSFYSKFKIILKLRKLTYKNIIIHDNKNRSKIISLFLKFKNKIVINNQDQFSHIDIIKDILKKLNFSFFENSLNILDHNKNENLKDNNILQLHFDEKWIHNCYIKKFVNIEPTEIELIDFINKIQAKTDKKIIITSGNNLPKVLENIIQNIRTSKVKIYKDLSFVDLEKVTSKSKVLISCHGAISHIAAAYKIKQVDIIDRSYNYKRWTDHFRNYNFIYRKKFNELTKEILEKI